MSINSALYTGVSGLNTNGQAMTVIGNNLANTNTVGYKGSRTIFSDLLSANVSGSGGSSQVGRGVGLSTVNNVFSQGTFETTESELDLAIEGESFFMLSPEDEETTYYSRAGAFSFDDAGYMVNPEGYRVQGIGYNAANELESGNPGDIVIDSSSLVGGKATDALTLTTNLDSNGVILHSTFDSADPTTYNFTETNTSQTDSNGDDVVTTTYYQKTDTNEWQVYYTAERATTPPAFTKDSTFATTIKLEANVAVDTATELPFTGYAPTTMSWVLADMVTPATPNSTSTQGTVSIADTTLPTGLTANPDIPLSFDYTNPDTFNYSSSVQTYDSLGNPHLLTTYFLKADENEWNVYYSAEADDGTIIPTDPNATIFSTLYFGENGQPVDEYGTDLAETPTKDTPAIDWANGSDPTAVTITFDTTQFNSESVVISQNQNGYGAGSFTGVSIDGDGNVIASYSNGEQEYVAAITLARFVNTLGLTMEGSNLYAETAASGSARVGLPGSELGSIFTNSLEQSNVDMGAEFVKMITVQRGYEANSKVITTVDDMLDTLINLKR